ncbi:hypothetical protein F4778DRAFT_740234 [Xylariomycetidae sp. FL2044]|nr:hypothetical protein F4778DRAFT_740234 [Xylariomycetidae sp. FL2044]
MSSPSFTLSELEFAACDVVQFIKQIPELGHTRLSVLGGLALWHYLPGYRPTNNINFVTNISTSPSSVKKRLLELPNSRFTMRQQVLFYQNPKGRYIQVDISPEWLCPYLPGAALNLRDIPYGEIPYVSLDDLIVFKLDSSGLRSSLVKKERDARDAAALIEHENTLGFPVRLAARQKQVVEEALCDVAKCGTKDKAWWERNLGLSSGSGLGPGPSSRGASPRPSSPSSSSSLLVVQDGSEGSHTRSKSRPHANSDSAYGGIYRGSVNEAHNTAWYYERLDRAHVKRFHSLHQTGGNVHQSLPPWSSSSFSPSPTFYSASSLRPGIARSASCAGYPTTTTATAPMATSAMMRGGNSNNSSRSRAGSMTSQPKTTNSNYYGYTCNSYISTRSTLTGATKRPSVGSDSGYAGSESSSSSFVDDGSVLYYHLDSPGAVSPFSSGAVGAGRDGYFDVVMGGRSGTRSRKGSLSNSSRAGGGGGGGGGGVLGTVTEREDGDIDMISGVIKPGMVKRSVTFQL